MVLFSNCHLDLSLPESYEHLRHEGIVLEVVLNIDLAHQVDVNHDNLRPKDPVWSSNAWVWKKAQKTRTEKWQKSEHPFDTTALPPQEDPKCWPVFVQQ